MDKHESVETMGIFLTVGCSICGIGFVVGIVTLVMQWIQIKKLRLKVVTLKYDVKDLEDLEEQLAKEQNKTTEDTSVIKEKPTGPKRVTFKDLSSLKESSIRGVAGTDTSNSFDRDFEIFVKFIEEYTINLKNTLSVSSSFIPGFIFNQFEADPPKKMSSFVEVLERFTQILFNATHWLHPNYFGPPGPGRSIPDLIAHFLKPLLKSEEIQQLPLVWLHNVFLLQFEREYPVESATEGHFHVLLATRNRMLGQFFEIEGYEKMVLYSSSEADYSVDKAAKLAMMRHHKVIGEMEAVELERQIQADKAIGLVPAAIFVTLGAYGVMTLESDRDRISEMAELAQKYNCWLHVDASSILGYWLSERGIRWKPALSGVDSIFGEIFLHAEGVKFVWTNHQKYWTEPLTNLQPGLELFFSFSLLGASRMGRHFDANYQLTCELENRLRQCKNIKIFSPMHSNNFYAFSFQYHAAEMCPDQIIFYTKRLYNYLQLSGKFVFGYREVRGTAVIVATVLTYLHETRTVDEIWNELNPLIEEFVKKKDDLSLLPPIVAPVPTHHLFSSSSKSTSVLAY